jgi:hypothetical protein
MQQIMSERELTLEVALFGLGITRESRLWLLLLQLIQDLFVGDIADLEVLLDQLPILVADATFAVGHHGVAGIVCLTDIAVDAGPTIVTLAFLLAASRRPVFAFRQ